MTMPLRHVTTIAIDARASAAPGEACAARLVLCKRSVERR